MSEEKSTLNGTADQEQVSNVAAVDNTTAPGGDEPSECEQEEHESKGRAQADVVVGALSCELKESKLAAVMPTDAPLLLSRFPAPAFELSMNQFVAQMTLRFVDGDANLVRQMMKSLAPDANNGDNIDNENLVVSLKLGPHLTFGSPQLAILGFIINAGLYCILSALPSGANQQAVEKSCISVRYFRFFFAQKQGVALVFFKRSNLMALILENNQNELAQLCRKKAPLLNNLNNNKERLLFVIMNDYFTHTVLEL